MEIANRIYVSHRANRPKIKTAQLTIVDTILFLLPGGRDACRGDSGGPLMLQDDVTNRYFTYGVVSWGDGCGREGNFGVYVRIENFVDWIQSKIRLER